MQHASERGAKSAAGPTNGSEHGGVKVAARVMLGRAIAMGPGKADLLAAVARTGSIAAAGRDLGLSYRRTRDMVDTLNACWKVPLIDTARGGSHGGGASLTDAGRTILDRYRALDRDVQRAAEAHAAGLLEMLGAAEG